MFAATNDSSQFPAETSTPATCVHFFLPSTFSRWRAFAASCRANFIARKRARPHAALKDQTRRIIIRRRRASFVLIFARLRHCFGLRNRLDVLSVSNGAHSERSSSCPTTERNFSRLAQRSFAEYNGVTGNILAPLSAHNFEAWPFARLPMPTLV